MRMGTRSLAMLAAMPQAFRLVSETKSPPGDYRNMSLFVSNLVAAVDPLIRPVLPYMSP